MIFGGREVLSSKNGVEGVDNSHATGEKHYRESVFLSLGHMQTPDYWKRQPQHHDVGEDVRQTNITPILQSVDAMRSEDSEVPPRGKRLAG